MCSISAVLIKMKAEVKNISGCNRLINIELSGEELAQLLDQVYADIGKKARVPGFRPGKIPRDLLETYYSDKAREEVIRRAIPEYYLLAVEQEKLLPVASPEVEDVQLKDHTLFFRVKVEVKPEVKIKSYKKLRLTQKRVKVEPDQVEQALERLRQSRAKEPEKDKQEKILPKLDDQFAKDSGFNSLQELREAISKNLKARAEVDIRADSERQIIDEIFKKASLDVPESLVRNQTAELLDRMKLNYILRGEKKEDLQAKEDQLQEQARKEAIQRVKLSFVLDKIAQLENIQVEESELNQRIVEIAQQSGKSEDQVRQYLDREKLFSSLKIELRDRKTMEFLLKEAKIEER